MTAKSRRNDANFLHDVSNKLAVAHLATPYVRDSTYVANRYPATATYPYSYTTYPYNSHPGVYYPSDYRRRTWYAPPVSDYEVDSYLAGGPGRYYSRYSRAGSVPPSSSSYVPRWTAPVVHKSPYENVAVGVAHTAQYGDIVIGIPYNKRHMFQNNNNHYKGGNNYKSYNNYKPYYYPSFANRHSVAPSYPSIGAVSVTPNYRRASIAVPYRSAYEADLGVSASPYSYYSGRQYGSGYTDLSAPGTRDSVAALRGRAQSVQKQLEGVPQFQFFDSVAPAGVSITRPRAASSIPTYRAAGASVVSTPVVSAVGKAYSGGSYSGSGYSGGGYSGGASVGGGAVPAAPGKYTKPPVSETRRKVRDLLCKSKKDPHYFD